MSLVARSAERNQVLWLFISQSKVRAVMHTQTGGGRAERTPMTGPLEREVAGAPPVVGAKIFTVGKPPQGAYRVLGLTIHIFEAPRDRQKPQTHGRYLERPAVRVARPSFSSARNPFVVSAEGRTRSGLVLWASTRPCRHNR